MSAFLVSDSHINTLVHFAATQRLTVYIDNIRLHADGYKQLIAQELKKANLDALTARYEAVFSGEDFKITYEPPNKPLSPIAVLKALHCLNYQCCEVENYEETSCRKFLKTLEYEIIRKLPGYEEAEWSLD